MRCKWPPAKTLGLVVRADILFHYATNYNPTKSLA